MFDSVAAFAKQFHPVEDGYLYYPSKKIGRKLITAEEYDELVDGWNRVAGRKGVWKTVGMVMLTIVVWSIVGHFFALPAWSDTVLTVGCVIGISGWLLWASFAPRRLVRDRPTIVPPRPISETKRQARALLNWRLVVFGLLLSGMALLGSLNVPERDFKSWAWLLGSGTIFCLYVWIAIQKFRDR